MTAETKKNLVTFGLMLGAVILGSVLVAPVTHFVTGLLPSKSDSTGSGTGSGSSTTSTGSSTGTGS